MFPLPPPLAWTDYRASWMVGETQGGGKWHNPRDGMEVRTELGFD